MNFASIGAARLPRRALLIMPVAFAGLIAVFRRRERVLPDPTRDGTGAVVTLAILSEHGQRKLISARKTVKSDDAWRQDLSSFEFAVTRRAATEPAFANRYWHTKTQGEYRCICCGNLVFLSASKFDSGTGWPSFSYPFAEQNIETKVDNSLSAPRTEVLCRKCDAHLGHVFEDGPPPTGLRYCLNSAALQLVEARQSS